MINKKAQGISMTYIIIAALALVVLVVIIMFFTGGLQKLFGQQTDVVEGSTDQQLEIWRNQCKLQYTMEKNKQGNCPNFCMKKFEKEEQIFICPELIDCSEDLIETTQSSELGELETQISVIKNKKTIKNNYCDCC